VTGPADVVPIPRDEQLSGLGQVLKDDGLAQRGGELVLARADARAGRLDSERDRAPLGWLAATADAG
jgi:hypothetical protein